MAGTLVFVSVLLSGLFAAGSANAAIWSVANEAELQAAISGAASGDVINITADIGLTSSLPVVSTNLTINGGGFTIDGASAHQAFFVDTGTVAINDMTITNCVSEGGDGGDGWNGGGGGLGAGGAIFVNTGASVSVSGVSFTSNDATGGDGGGYVAVLANGGGGGGGYGGDGQDSTVPDVGGEGGSFRTDGGGGAAGGGAGGDFEGGGGGTDGGLLVDGGNGGFGGGGGANAIGGGIGGDGGFGGGGAGADSIQGTPGTGGGATTGLGGGGGAGFGGAVFVRDGGSFTVNEGGFSGNTAAGGLGYVSQGGQDGTGEGQALYMMSGVNVFMNITGSVSVGDTIGGAGSITKTGAGRLTLSGANTYTGTTDVNAGVLNVQNNTALGTTASGTTVASGAALELQGGITIGEPLTLNGTGVSNGGALRNISGNNAVTGLITLGSASRINSDADTLTLGNIGGAGQNLTIGGAGNTSVNGVIGTTTGSLTKDGAGILTLSGANTYTGGTTVSNGTLRLGISGALADSGAMTVNSPGVFDVFGMTETIGSLAGGGSVTLGSGALTTGGNNTSTTYSGVMSGTGFLTKTGTGIMTLSGANTFTGGMTISNGTLRLGASNVLADTLPMYLNSPGIFDVNGYTERVGSIQGAANVMLGSGTLYAGGLNSNTTYSGVMSGTGGSFVKEGSGYMYMTGPNTYTGPTTVAGGRLFVNGSLQSHVTVNSGAGLNGTGVIWGGVTNNGEVSPEASYGQIGTLYIATSYAQGAGGMYRAEVHGNGTADLLDIEGPATLNGTLSLSSLGGTYGIVSVYTLLTASGGLGGTTFSSFGDSLPSYLDTYLTYDTNNVLLRLIRNDVDFGTVGNTYNQRSVGRGLNNELLTATGDMIDLLNTIFFLPASEQPAALDSLAGEVHTAVAQSSLGFLTGFMNTVNARLAQARGEMRASSSSSAKVLLASADDGMTDAGPMYASSAQDGSRAGLWIKGYGLFGETDSDGNAHGYDYTIGGSIGGLEFDNGSGLVLGMGGGYGVTGLSLDGTVDGISESGGVKSTQAIAYAGYKAGPVYVDVAGGYAYNRYDTTRHISLTGANAKANYTADEYSAMVEAGYGMGLAGLDVVPLASFQWTRLDTDGFTETGAGAANLEVEERSSNSLKYGAGLKVAKNYVTSGGWSVVPELRGKWTHESGNNDQTIDAGFAGGSGGTFPIHGLDIGRDKAEVGAGFSIFRAKGIGLALDYDAQLNEEQTAHAFTGEIRYMW